MPRYRFCLMDEVGSVTSLADHDCADDAAAVALAATLMPQRARAEVWLGAKLVGSIAAAMDSGGSAGRAGAGGPIVYANLLALPYAG